MSEEEPDPDYTDAQFEQDVARASDAIDRMAGEALALLEGRRKESTEKPALIEWSSYDFNYRITEDGLEMKHVRTGVWIGVPESSPVGVHVLLRLFYKMQSRAYVGPYD